MKVRHKLTSKIYDVIEASSSFYIVPWAGTVESALPVKDCEVLPTETWRKVTGECEWSDWSGKFLHKADKGKEYWVEGPDYRLRKVQLFKPAGHHAFIIEKREP